jgi:hypothetical protein
MRNQTLFQTPPYDVVLPVGVDQALLEQANPAIRFVLQPSGMVLAQLGVSIEAAATFADGLKSLLHVSGWVVPTAYRSHQVTQEVARDRAASELRELQLASPQLHFSALRPTIALGNPMTWAFVTEVHALSKPDASWRRHIEIDRATGETWDEKTYSQYRLSIAR